MAVARNSFVLLTVLCALIAIAVGQSHNWSMGTYRPGDRLLSREIVRKSASTLQVVTTDRRYPTTGQGLETITFMNSTDQYVNGDGGYVTLYEGGVGLKYVELHYKSQRGHGFNFITEIYGK